MRGDKRRKYGARQTRVVVKRAKNSRVPIAHGGWDEATPDEIIFDLGLRRGQNVQQE